MSDNTWIIWDLDGTLYEETHDIKGIFKNAVCDALREVVDPGLTDEQAHNLIRESRKQYGDSFSGLVRKGFNAGVLHETHHAKLDARHISANPATIDSFTESQARGVNHAILTHVHMNWVTKVLDKAGLSDFFSEDRIISTEKIGYLKKHTGPEAFERALDSLGVKAGNAVMVEDKAANLVYPSQMGMKTILLCYEDAQVPAEKPAYVSQICRSPAETIDTVLGTGPVPSLSGTPKSPRS